MIQVKNLVKEFDGLRALDGLCLNVPDGCVYGLVGPNGAGKTGFPRVCRSRPRSGWPFPAVRII